MRHGRALFDPRAVSFDREALANAQGPFPAWVLFTWKINEKFPDTFSTVEDDIRVFRDTPASGWTTEDYLKAQILHPPMGSGNMVMVRTKDHNVEDAWNEIFKQVTSESHLHIEEIP